MRSVLRLAAGLALVGVIGCAGEVATKPKSPPSGTAKGAKDDQDHDHGPGPHKGTIADWGDGSKYHVEFCVDHATKEATVYVLGSNGETAAPIKAKDDQITLSIKEPVFQVTLKALPQKGDPDGKASRFVGKDDRFGKEQEFAGTISGEVDGKPYAGDFKEEPAKKK